MGETLIVFLIEFLNVFLGVLTRLEKRNYYDFDNKIRPYALHPMPYALLSTP